MILDRLKKLNLSEEEINNNTKTFAELYFGYNISDNEKKENPDYIPQYISNPYITRNKKYIPSMNSERNYEKTYIQNKTNTKNLKNKYNSNNHNNNQYNNENGKRTYSQYTTNTKFKQNKQRNKY